MIVISVAAFISVAAVAIGRLGYDHEIEWLEGAMVDHVRRVLAGREIYVSPTISFTPLIYPPLYFYVAALVAGITGAGYLPLRLVSVLSSLGVLLLIGRLVWSETREAWRGMVAAGLFAATFELTGSWLDLARVDSLMLVMAMAALVVGRRATSWRGAVGAAVLTASAYLTKQTGLVVAVPLAIWLLKRGRALGWTYLSAVTSLLAAVTLVMNRLSDGWYLFYTYELPVGSRPSSAHWAEFWTVELRPLWPALVATAVFVLVSLIKGDEARRWFYSPLLIAAVVAAYISWLRPGSYKNDLLLVALASAIGLAMLLPSRLPSKTPLRARAVPCLLLVACFLQFLRLVYDPIDQLPTAANRAAARDLAARLRSLEGPIFMQSHGWVAVREGKGTSAHIVAMYEVIQARDDRPHEVLMSSLSAAVASQRYKAIVVDSGCCAVLPPNFSRFYASAGHLIAHPERLDGLTGVVTHPNVLYLPRPRPTIGSPAPGSTLSGDADLVTPANDERVVRVEFHIFGGLAFDHTVGVATRRACCGWVLRWDTTSVSNGEYEVSSVAINANGVSGRSPNVLVTVAN